MVQIETAKIFSVEECEANPNKLYVFGENEEQQGKNHMGGGQAIIRPCSNSFGFCTLTSIGEPWLDKNLPYNTMKIEADIASLRTMSKDYEVIVFPKYGLGTGRAHMIKLCPKTFLYLCNRLLDEFNYNNIEHLKVPQF